MRKTKQFLALGLAAILMATTLAGCGGGSSDSGSGSSSGSSDAAGTEDAAGADAADAGTEADAAGGDSASSSGDKLLVALTTSSFVTDYENNYFTNLLEERLGFELEFYMLPAEATETRTKVALMATSNEQQPDVMITDGHLTNEMILQYGSSGFFLPLNDYVSDPEKMPNYNAIPEEDRELMNKASTQADGNIYSLSAWEPETWNLTPNRMFINKAWLDKLGLSIPTTTDELKEVLIAFRDGDPNGNGAQDEVGVYGQSSGGYGENITAALMNAFVFWNGGGTNGGLALSDLADALPEGYHFILFDACLMSGIEVAYALRYKTEYILASPAEVLVDGFPYQKIMPLLWGDEPALREVCKEFWNYYENHPNGGGWCSGTIALIRTEFLDALAGQVRDILAGKTELIAGMTPADVWRYPLIDFNQNVFFDLGAYVRKLASENQYHQFKVWLEQAVYRLATTRFNGIPIPSDEYSGLSVYIPMSGWIFANNEYYRLEWSRYVYDK